MPVKLSEIEGLMLEKWQRPEHGDCNCVQCSCVQGYNQAVDDHGPREIGLNREKLDQILYDLSCNEYGDAQSKYDLTLQKDRQLIIDAIIAKEHTLLEVK